MGPSAPAVARHVTTCAVVVQAAIREATVRESGRESAEGGHAHARRAFRRALASVCALGAARTALAFPTLTLVRPGEPGTPLTLGVQVVDRHGRAMAGAHVHVYQTDAAGRYTPTRAMDEPHARLSGFVLTDADGAFAVRTIRPGGYPRAVRWGASIAEFRPTCTSTSWPRAIRSAASRWCSPTIPACATRTGRTGRAGCGSPSCSSAPD
jgi:hypothetical protein